MRKKFFAMYALVGALVASPVFTSCVDDSESASVTAIRNAKAEQLKAAAELSKAQAEAEIIEANAEAALKAAQAAHEQALANATEAEQARLDQEFAIKLDSLKAAAELGMLKVQQLIETEKNNITDGKITRFGTLVTNYTGALSTLNTLKGNLITSKNSLAALEAGVISAETVNKNTIAAKEKEIALAEAKIALLKDPAYKTMDKAELEAKQAAATLEYNLGVQTFNASGLCQDLMAVSETLKSKITEYDNLVSDISNINVNVQNLLSIPYNLINGFEYDWFNYKAYYSVNFNNAPYSGSGRNIPRYYQIDEVVKLNATRALAAAVETELADLGKADDDKTKTTAYGFLAAANAALADAKALPETTDAEKATKKTAIENAEDDIAAKTNALAYAKQDYADAVKAQTTFEELLKACDVAAATKLAEETVAAIKAVEDAYTAYDEGKGSVTEKLNAKNAIDFLVNNASYDFAAQINAQQAIIDAAKLAIANAQNNTAEQTLENTKKTIAELEYKIKLQELVVAERKALLDAYLAENETEEDTEVEEDTEAEA